MGKLICGDVLQVLPTLPEKVDLVFGSPPYEDCRSYGIDFNLKGESWVAWMGMVVVECLKKCNGLVAFVVEGKTRKFRWSAVPVLLMADLHRAGIHLRKPPAFHRVGIPGSGGPDWLRNDYEFIVCATNGGRLPWSDNTAMGMPCKFRPGGKPSHRTQDGRRVDVQTRRKADGVRLRDGMYKEPKLANPGNVIHCKVGGGLMGSELTHENEAPFPETLAEFFIKSFCPPKYCHSCGYVIGTNDDDSKQKSYVNMPPLRKTVCNVQKPNKSGKGKVLQSEVPVGFNEASPRDMRMVQGDNSDKERKSQLSFLQQGVCMSVDCTKPVHNQAENQDDQGICISTLSKSSECNEGRICDGTSTCDGEGDRSIFGPARSCPPHQRSKGRQSTSESSPYVEVESRPNAKESDNPLPTVSSPFSVRERCEKCGAYEVYAGVVLDPFAGSGTTCAVAKKTGRNYIGIDVRESQIELTKRRLEEIDEDDARTAQ